jgi:hypothetical protein
LHLVWSWQGVIGTAITLIAAVYYGPRKVQENWRWYRREWFDSKVLRYMEEHKETAFARGVSVSRTVADISADLDISAKAAGKRLERLRIAKLVKKHGENWFLP